jgi:hypothetical protein
MKNRLAKIPKQTGLMLMQQPVPMEVPKG